MKRKVIQLAGKTHVVSLPSKWVQEHHIKKGDDIEVMEEGSKLIIATRKGATGGFAKISVGGLGSLTTRVVGALYKAGYDEVEVLFDSIEELKKIQDVVREGFVGFEVIEQGRHFLRCKRISQLEESEFEILIRRLFLIILSMARDSLDALQKKDREWLQVIITQDKDVNKIADFCRRVLNMKFGFESTGPDYFITEQLENIGDFYKNICKHSLTLSSLSADPELVKIYKEINNYFDSFYKVYFKFDLKELAKLADKQLDLTKRIGKLNEALPRKELHVLFLLNNVLQATFDLNGPLMVKSL